MKRIILLLVGLLLTGCNQAVGNVDLGNKEVVNDKALKLGIIQFAEHSSLDATREGFVEELEEMGYELEIDYVNVQSDLTLIPTTIRNFEAHDVDLIYAIATPAAQGAKNTARRTPIIFNAVTDPIAAELVKANGKPGGNITGVSDYFSISKQVDMFLEAFPNTKDFGLIYSTGELNSQVQIAELEEILKDKNINLHKVGVTTTNDIPSAMASLSSKIDAFIGIQDNLVASSSKLISQKLNEKKIPSFSGEDGLVVNGFLMSDGIDYTNLGQRAAKQADEIMNGKKVSDIPVEFSEETGRLVNKKTYDILTLDNPEVLKDAEIYE